MFPNDFESEFTFENAAVPLPEEPPFHVLILGDWSGDSARKGLNERQAIEVDRDNYEDVLKKLKAVIDLDLYGDENAVIRLQFEELDDFHPDNLFRKVSLFSDLRDVRRRLSDSDTFNLAAQEVRSWFSASDDKLVNDAEVQSQIEDTPPIESNNLLDLILDQPDVSNTPVNSRITNNSELGRFVSKIISPHLIKIDEDEQLKLVSTVDRAISELMRAILHHPKFRSLESAWRALYLLVRRVETDSNLKIFILDVLHQEIIDNLKLVNTLTDSFLYARLTARSYSVIAGNYSFGLNVDDIAMLMRVGKLAYDFNAPFISHIKPEIFGIENFLEARDVYSLDVIEDSKEFKLWDALRNIPEASHVGLSPMRVLGRMPYGEMTDSVETFSFEESDETIDFEKLIWLNPCFIVALLLAQSYRIAESDMKNNLLHDTENLPMYVYREDDESKTLPCAEIVLTEKLLDKILAQGMIPLISFRDSNRIRVGRYQSISSNAMPLNGRWNA